MIWFKKSSFFSLSPERNFKKIFFYLSLTLLVTLFISSSALALTSETVSDGGDLHTAIANANNSSDNYEIILEAGTTYYLSSELSISKSSGTLTIKSSSETTNAIIDGENQFRVFTISGSTVTLQYLTIQNGSTSDDGGGIYVYSSAKVTIENSTIANNQATNTGGAIASYGGTVTIKNSALTNNTATYGGGLHQNSSPTTKIINSTIANNQATNTGGGLTCSSGSLTVANSTIVNNISPQGAGIYRNSGNVYLYSTLVANNETLDETLDNFYGTVNSLGYNLVTGSEKLTSTSPETQANDKILDSTVTGLVNDLADNGGPTQTCSLPSGSQANDAGPSADKLSEMYSIKGWGSVPDYDQRGDGYSRVVREKADVGAYEDDQFYASAALSITTNGAEGSPPTAMVFTVTLSEINNTGEAITFDFATSGGTASAGTDYTAVSGTGNLTIADGENTGTISVTVIDDSILEETETVICTISNPSSDLVTITTASVIGNIEDNENFIAALSITTNGAEGSPPTAMVFTVTLSETNNSGEAITFDFATDGGTASAGSDYTAVSGTGNLTIADGENTGTISVTVLDDSILEETETVICTITNPSHTGVSISTSNATGNIIDDETITATLSVTTDGAEGSTPTAMVFTVTLSEINNTGEAITFDFATSDGTASAGSDYTAVSGTGNLTIADGATTGTISVTVSDDSLLEGTETVTGTISNPSHTGVSISTASAIGNIIDDDAGVIVSPVSISVSEGGTGGTYTLVLNTQPSGDVVIDVSSNNSDVSVDPISVTFTASNWDIAKTITVSAAEDDDVVDESVVISNAVNESTADANYDGITIDSVSVTVTDNYIDSDNDGVSDVTERSEGTDPNDGTDYADLDKDGCPDSIEDDASSEPADSDGDGVADVIEEMKGTDSSDASDASKMIEGYAYVDKDKDGSLDSGEKLLGGWIINIENIYTAETYQVTTNSEGYYSVDLLVGNYLVSYYNANDDLMGVGAETLLDVNSTTSVANLSLPIDPSGVIYDSVTGLAVSGAIVELLDGEGKRVDGNALYAGGSNPVKTGDDGFYSFVFDGDYLDTATGTNGETFTLKVTPPDGYVLSILHPPVEETGGEGNEDDDPENDGTGEFDDDLLEISGGAIQARASGKANVDDDPIVEGAVYNDGTHAYRYAFDIFYGGGYKGEVFQNHIPLDPQTELETYFTVTKEANKTEVTVGEPIIYTVSLTNSGTISDDIYLYDQMPAGFKYVKGSTLIGGAKADDPIGSDGRNLKFSIVEVSSGSTVTVKYQLVAGTGVIVNEAYVNKAYVQYGENSVRLSNIAGETIIVVADPLFDLGTVIGKVYQDKNRNGFQDNGEAGVASAKIVTARGVVITTDNHGKYHLNGINPGRHLFRLDERPFPEGTIITTDKLVVVDVTEGSLKKVDFGIILPKKAGGGDDKPVAVTSSKEAGEAIARSLDYMGEGFAQEPSLAEESTAEESSLAEKAQSKSETSIFFVALGDIKAGYNKIQGNIEMVEGRDGYDQGLWDEGNIAYYLQGKIKGKYLITSSFDLNRDQKEMFKTLDSDKYYPVYGDQSTINYGADNTQGKLYVKVEWDNSEAVWGNYRTGLNDTEFSKYSKTLYGGKVKYETVSQTKNGKAKTKLIIFKAVEHERTGYNEFLATGGTLYYLKDRDLVEGSEEIKLEVRDEITGLVLKEESLIIDEDYSIDYDQGRITFYQPILSKVESESILTDGYLEGNDVYVVAGYKYESDDIREQDNYGGRITQAVGDYVEVGATLIREDQEDDNYELKGSDVKIYVDKNIEIVGEYAESKSQALEVHRSQDGGLSFEEVSVEEDVKGKAYGIKTKASFMDDRANISMYYKKIDLDFSTATTSSVQGKTLSGGSLSYRPWQGGELRFRHDQEKAVDADDNTEKVDMTNIAASQGYKNLNITTEYEERRVEGEDTEDNLAVAASYTPTDDLKIWLGQENLLADIEDQSTRIGIEGTFYEDIKLRLEETIAKDEQGTSLRLSKLDPSGNEVYTSYAQTDDGTAVNFGKTGKTGDLSFNLDNEFSSGDSSEGYGTGISVSKKMESGGEIEGEYKRRYNVGESETSSSNIFSIATDIARHLEVGVSYEQGEVDTDDTDDIMRHVGNITLDYDNKEIKWLTKLELRLDKGTEDIRQYVGYAGFERKANEDISLFFEGDFSLTENSAEEVTDGSYKEINAGMAYRPIDDNKMNWLTKYTYQDEKTLSSQTDTEDIYSSRAHILGLEGIYSLNSDWDITGKLAFKYAKEKNLSFETWNSLKSLILIGLSHDFLDIVKVGCEYRILMESKSEELKKGFLVELTKDLGKYLELGVGYNFTDFNADLGDLDYQSHGVFMRMTGKLDESAALNFFKK